MKVLSTFAPAKYSADRLCSELLFAITQEDDPSFETVQRNRIINGRRNIPPYILEKLETTDAAEHLRRFFSNVYLKDEENRPNLISLKPNLKKLIESCDEPDVAKSQLLEALNSDQLPDGLVYIFRYATKKPNVTGTESITPEDLELINGVERRCPLCHKPLITKENGKTIFLYNTIKVFPDGLNNDLRKDFVSVHPKTRDDEILPLCQKCADEYLFEPTVENYEKLWTTNNQIKIKDKIEKAKNDVNLDTQLEEIVVRLKDLRLSDEDVQELKLNPLCIKKKIKDNYPLEHSICTDLDYFPRIQHMLSDLDSDEADFDTIASEFKTIYKKFAAGKASQSKIYEEIIEWVIQKLSLDDDYKPAAKLVVSFFVQDCEVFDEITE